MRLVFQLLGAFIWPLSLWGQNDNQIVFVENDTAFYAGIDNPIRITGEKCKDIRPSVTVGRVQRGDSSCLWIVQPGYPGSTELTLKKGNEAVFRITVPVRRLSDPKLLAVGKVIIPIQNGSENVKAETLASIDSFIAKDNVPWTKTRVLRFEVTIRSKRGIEVFQNEGHKLMDEIKRRFEKLKLGDEIWFDTFRVTGPDDTQYPTIKFVIE